MYEMTDCLIAAQLGAQAHIRNIDPNVLIVGAGGGQELITLGERHEAWSFTAVDPSEHMLDLARKRVTHAGISSTISFVAGTLEESSRGPSLEDWERFAASIGRESNPVSNAAIQELLIDAGFTHITRYYGAFLVIAWFAVKEGETTYDKG